MKTAACIFVLTALVAISACKKPEQDISEARGLGFDNKTDKAITVKFHTLLKNYLSDKATAKGYTLNVPAGTHIVMPIKFGGYYIDWYSNDYQYSNWGSVIDSSSSGGTGTNSVWFNFTQASNEYTAAQNTTRATFIDSVRTRTWIQAVGLKDGQVITKPLAVRFTINRNYTVAFRYNLRKEYNLFTNSFGQTTTLTDSASQKYIVTIVPGPNVYQDTLLLKLPFTDTTYKLYKHF